MTNSLARFDQYMGSDDYVRAPGRSPSRVAPTFDELVSGGAGRVYLSDSGTQGGVELASVLTDR